MQRNPGAKIYMATTKAKKIYSEASYEPDCYIMFGKESAGIPEEILVEHPEECVRIPMIGETRSLNLSNSVAIVLYEALRQNQFDHMKLEGDLHRLHWGASSDTASKTSYNSSSLKEAAIPMACGKTVASPARATP